MISSELGIDPELTRGDNGVFDVLADEKLVFSKDASGRFPEHAEVLEVLQAS